jgi:hypothetical protein
VADRWSAWPDEHLAASLCKPHAASRIAAERMNPHFTNETMSFRRGRNAIEMLSLHISIPDG